jgi:hypothetical protein
VWEELGAGKGRYGFGEFCIRLWTHSAVARQAKARLETFRVSHGVGMEPVDFESVVRSHRFFPDSFDISCRFIRTDRSILTKS